jgi:5-methyltetrahydrofolate--homocysteine methyltransferase
MADMQAMAEAIIKGDREGVVKLVHAALDEGVDPRTILKKGLIAGMDIVGKRFKANEIYVPEVLIAARAMSNHKQPDKPGAMEILKPELESAGVEPSAKVLVGTVKGDLHDIGKNLVVMMLRGSGFDVEDLGVDVPSERFVQAVKDHDAKLLGLSSLLTTSMPHMKAVIESLRAADCGDCKVMIGGAPVTQEYADEIGADGYAADAASAVDAAKELLGIT